MLNICVSNIYFSITNFLLFEHLHSRHPSEDSQRYSWSPAAFRLNCFLDSLEYCCSLSISFGSPPHPPPSRGTSDSWTDACLVPRWCTWTTAVLWWEKQRRIIISFDPCVFPFVSLSFYPSFSSSLPTSSSSWKCPFLTSVSSQNWFVICSFVSSCELWSTNGVCVCVCICVCLPWIFLVPYYLRMQRRPWL